MEQFYAERTIDAPREILWNVITDQRLYGEAADNLSNVEVLEGKGKGMRRKCRNSKGETWSESCVRWKEGEAYSFEVDTTDYPYPLSRMRGTWGIKGSVRPLKVYMRFEYKPRYGMVGRLLMKLLVGEDRFRRVCNGILDVWESRAKQRSEENIPEETKQ